MKMKLTKKLETEILKVYKTYWDSYNNGDIKTFAGTLDKTFELIGTSESEICHTREDGIRFIKAQVKELVGKVEMRNRKISLVPVNELMLVNEQCDIYFLNGRDWSFYSKIRISTFLRKTTSGWKVFQQHGSLPDMRVQEGETLAVKKISKENLQLKEAIKRRTVELEQKNRELEVETALEKVRAVALGMKKAEDMLSICKTISQQLAKLGVKEIRNVQTAIFNVPAGTYMNYEFYAKHDKTFITETLYTNHKVARAFAAKMLKGKGEVSITHIKGKEKVKEWLNYQKGTNVFIDTYLNKATSLTYYWFSLGPVALGISTYLPLTKEELQLFQRFLNVFELAYRRYLDIEKASAQAKEAEIQLALERVRARTMAMQKSEELGETSFLLFQQFKGLGVTSDQISIGIFKEDENSMELYSTLYGSQWKEAATVDLDEPVVINKIYAAWKKQKKSLVIDLTGNDLRKYNRYRKKLSNINYKEKRWVIHIAFFSKGMLTFSATKPHPQETMQLLERFTGVFDLTYTRFLDLQKAEAQAREAQIEAALERIRARALAMHSSDEFTDVARVMREQMGQLGQQELETSAVHLYDEDAEYILSWRAFRLSSDLKSKINYGFFKIPKNSCKIAREFVQKFKSKATDYTIEISGVMQTEWYKILFKLAPEVQAAMKKSGTTKEKRYYHFSKFSGGSLLMVSSKEPSNDAIELQKRAAQVFDLAYRRFKDLQKAEAQAREAQIQLALERVRARTMAMHHSDELTNVVKLLYQEFDKLKISNESTDIEIGLIDEDTGLAKIWAHLYLSDGSISTFNFPFAHFDSLNDEFKKWRSTPVEKRNELFITTEFSGKLWNKFKKLAREVPELAGMFESLIAGNIKKWVTHNAYFSHGLLTLQGTEHYSQEIQEILKRFAKVFEQTYTRFLDLQKAEAQAREAQVEAALEKVRSRSLAMHKSDELEEVIMVVSEQLQQLKFRFHNVSFGINNERRDFNFWMASPGVAHPFLLAVPYIDNPAITHPLKARSKGVDFISDILSFEENKAWLQHLFEYSVLKNVSEDHKNFLLATKRFARSQVLNKHTILTIGNYAGVPYTDEQNDILKRFGNVFEQAYTRFLELQKAEAQAREAQIKQRWKE